MSARPVQTRSEDETVAWGEQLAGQLPRPAVVLLVGGLGAGKTTLAKGIVKGLKAAPPEDVTSPTFTLIHEYGAYPKVYHIDLYRLERLGQARALGLDELMSQDAILLVEWGERFPELWPADHIEIRLTRLEEETRELSIRGVLLSGPGP